MQYITILEYKNTELSLHDYTTILSSLSSGCVYRKVPYKTLIQACYDEEHFPWYGMGLNPATYMTIQMKR